MCHSSGKGNTQLFYTAILRMLSQKSVVIAEYASRCLSWVRGRDCHVTFQNKAFGHAHKAAAMVVLPLLMVLPHMCVQLFGKCTENLPENSSAT